MLRTANVSTFLFFVVFSCFDRVVALFDLRTGGCTPPAKAHSIRTAKATHCDILENKETTAKVIRFSCDNAGIAIDYIIASNAVRIVPKKTARHRVNIHASCRLGLTEVAHFDLSAPNAEAQYEGLDHACDTNREYITLNFSTFLINDEMLAQCAKNPITPIAQKILD